MKHYEKVVYCVIIVLMIAIVKEGIYDSNGSNRLYHDDFRSRIHPTFCAPCFILRDISAMGNVPESEALVDEAESQAFTEEDKQILSIIICQEAGGDDCSDLQRYMVGNVFLNRVNDPRFPNTFYEVATAKGQYGRLHWTGLQFPAWATTDVIERSERIAVMLLESEFLLLPNEVVFQAEFRQGGGTYVELGGHYFCY